MKVFLTKTWLGIPVTIWTLQLLYVAFSLIVLSQLYGTFHKKTDLAIFLVIMIVLNVVWRLAIRKIF